MLERTFKKRFREKLIAMKPDIEIFEPNPTQRRSSPDMLLFDGIPDEENPIQVWAALEFKASKNSSHRPNQDYRVSRLSKKGYASFVYPENEMEVLDELEKLFPS